MKIKNLFKTGKLLDLHFRCRTGQVQINPEELGLRDIPEELIVLGRKRLLRAELVGRPPTITAMARRYIDSISYYFPIASARFIPNSLQEVAEARLCEYKRDFEEAVSIIADEYESEKEQMLKIWKTELERRSVPNSNSIVESIRNQYMDRDKFVGFYKFRWTWYELECNSKSEKEAISEFTQEVVTCLRTKVVELAGHVADLIKNKDKMLSEKSINSIQKQIELLLKLNFYEDEEVKRILEDMKRSITATAKTEDIENAIGNTINLSIKNIEEIVNDSIKKIFEGKRTIRVD